MSAPEIEFNLLSNEESDDSSVESDRGYDEGNPDDNSSSENSIADSS